MKIIFLAGGKKTKVDDEDYEYLAQFRWYVDNAGYVRRKTTYKRMVYEHFMHKVINETPEGLRCKHLNGDTLDNRKVNLKNMSWSEVNKANYARRRKTKNT